MVLIPEQFPVKEVERILTINKYYNNKDYDEKLFFNPARILINGYEYLFSLIKFGALHTEIILTLTAYNFITFVSSESDLDYAVKLIQDILDKKNPSEFEKRINFLFFYANDEIKQLITLTMAKFDKKINLTYFNANEDIDAYSAIKENFNVIDRWETVQE